jgi:hypothetical protein
MTIDFDVDIDFADRDKALIGLPHVPAMIDREGNWQRHNSGVYFQDIPRLPNGISALNYHRAPEYGYFKVDFLNQSVYRDVRDEEHLVDLLNREPMWELFDEKEIVEQLTHIHGHYDIVQKIKPRSIEDLAVVIALIRPGKRSLLDCPRYEIDSKIWTKNDEDGYIFKKAHAISYAALIVVQLNRLCEVLADDSHN